MVALRVVIGWHFFQEGLSHKNDPHWSSEGFLRQAKGPLAEQFQSHAPGFHKWDVLLAVPLASEPQPLPNEGSPQGKADNIELAPAEAKSAAQPNEGNPQPAPKAAVAKPNPADSRIYGQWYRQVIGDWRLRRDEIANFYRFSDEQKQSSDQLLDHYAEQLANLLANAEADITVYRHQLSRNVSLGSKPEAEEIPNQITRLSNREQNPIGEPGVTDTVNSNPSDWLGDAHALETAYQRDLLVLRNAEQLKLGQAPQTKTELQKIDTAVTWLLIVGGGLLMIGLFTRLSALALALFLVTVIATQPPWVAGSVETYYQGVECVALLALASSAVGRWAGVDFFIHHVFFRPFRAR
jgi:uncharacterized membrane protein YphA (DoxX/SURF4 family)